jgi:hypothetical protein
MTTHQPFISATPYKQLGGHGPTPASIASIPYENPHALHAAGSAVSAPPSLQFELARHPGVNYNTQTASYVDLLSPNRRGTEPPSGGDSVISRVFFCPQNIQLLQNGIRAGVARRSEERGTGEMIVGRQNEDQLKLVMRSVFLQNVSEFERGDVTRKVEELNALVLDYCVKNVYDETLAYRRYIRDASTLAAPIDHPQNVRATFMDPNMPYRSLELPNRGDFGQA